MIVLIIINIVACLTLLFLILFSEFHVRFRMFHTNYFVSNWLFIIASLSVLTVSLKVLIGDYIKDKDIRALKRDNQLLQMKINNESLKGELEKRKSETNSDN